MQSPKKAKLARAFRWLSPSAAAACGGALAAGVWDGVGMHGPLAIGATAGFVGLFALPVLFVASVIVRGLWAAWEPDQLAVVDEGGGAPRLGAWLGVGCGSWPG